MHHVHSGVARSCKVAPVAPWVRMFSSGAAPPSEAEIRERVMNVAKDFEKLDPKLITPTSNFTELGLDSLDMVELVIALEQEFVVDIPDTDAESIRSVQDAVEYLRKNPYVK